MRTAIIGLSIVFFLLSAVVLYKGLSPPSNLPLTARDMIDTVPELAEVSPAQENTRNIPKNKIEAVTESITITKDTPVEPIIETNSAKHKEEVIATEKPLDSPPIHAVENSTSEADAPYGVLAIFGGKTFRSGEDKVNDIANLKIEKLISEIALFPDALISVEGHSDNLPVGRLHKNNMNLSIMRARAIANLLIERGIARDRISIIGYGDTRPINSNHTEEGRGKNRRVEVRLTKKDQGVN